MGKLISIRVLTFLVLSVAHFALTSNFDCNKFDNELSNDEQALKEVTALT